MTSRRLHLAPELEHLPGQVEYTPELYALLKRLHESPGTPPSLLQEWHDLQEEHLRRLPVAERHTHALILTPRATFGGLELMVYPAGLGIMVVTMLTLVMMHIQPAFAMLYSLLIGSLGMLLLNRASLESHQRAHARLGMALPPDRDHGLNV